MMSSAKYSVWKNNLELDELGSKDSNLSVATTAFDSREQTTKLLLPHFLSFLTVMTLLVNPGSRYGFHLQ